jgi:hypothetical protein
MRFKSFKIGKSKEKPDKDQNESGDTHTTPIAGMEEHVSERTEDLKATDQELEKLSDTAKDSKEDESASDQPHGPLGELSVEPGDELLDEEADAGTLLGETDEEEVKVVKVGADAKAEAEAKVVEVEADAKAEAEKESADEGESDSLNNLFSLEEDDVNPLASLIGSLPDVTVQELLDDLAEIDEIIKEWQQR